jgi:hypothetical protein
VPKGLRDPLALQEVLVLLVHKVPKEHKDKEETKGLKVLGLQQEREGHKETWVLLELKEKKDYKVLREVKEPWVRRETSDSKVHKEVKGLKVQEVHKELKELLVYKEVKGLKVQEVHKELKGRQGQQVTRALKV